MRVVDVYIAFYLGGMLLWLTFANFGAPAWDHAYFIWEAVFGSSIFSWLAIFCCSENSTRKKVFPVLLYTCFHLIWEVICAVAKIDYNNEIGVMVLFLIAITITGCLAFRPQGFLPKLFEKHLNL